MSCHLSFSFQNVILGEGEKYAGLLYSWRSLSRAVPAVSLLILCSTGNMLVIVNAHIGKAISYWFLLEKSTIC